MLNQNNAGALVPDNVEQIRTRLESAAAGLSDISPGAARFRFLHLPAPGSRRLTPPALGALLDVPSGTPVREVTLDDFLAAYTGTADRGDEPSRMLRERFRALADAFVQNLEEPRLFRVGEGHYFLVGWTPDGALAGLRTAAAEP